jgi:biotin carboxylase
MDEKRELQIYEISRDDFEKMGQSLGEEEVMQRVIALLHGLDDTRAKVIRLDPDTLVMYTRAIEAAAQQIGLPVIVKPLSDGIAIALDTDEDRARRVRLNALTQPPSP